MKRHWIEYSPTRARSPMTFWVHVLVDGTSADGVPTFDPPLPPITGGRGYPMFLVEVDGFTFRFASLAELRACIMTLAQKHLPTTIRLSQGHGGAGPNGHWLSRLPRETKSWRYRERAVAYMQKALADFEQEHGNT